jgi:uncharacterized NAD(P)/FAD-binding protein YdhS
VIDAHAHDVVIIGGGFSGAVAAWQLVTRDPGCAVTIVEPAERIGRGIAYATVDPQHMLNVPAVKMGAVDGDPEHFLRWLDGTGRADEFIARGRYGEYVEALFAEVAARVTHVRARATRIVGERVLLDDGEALHADAVVLATGPFPTQDVSSTGAGWFASPWEPGALDVAPGEHVLLVGAGLTAVDAALSTCAAHADTRVTLVSRSARLPEPHLDPPLRAPVDPPRIPDPLLLDDLVANVRRACLDVEAAGGDWRDVVDSLRPLTIGIWRGMSVDDRARFVADHAREWERRRHRMAPSVATRMHELLDAGRARVIAGDARDAAELAVELGATRVIACTGFGTEVARATDPLVRSLLDDGIALPDELGRGLLVDVDGRVLPGSGERAVPLFAIGALRRGSDWETTAVPELRAQAARIASLLT